jgi:hypothetical protein
VSRLLPARWRRCGAHDCAKRTDVRNELSQLAIGRVLRSASAMSSHVDCLLKANLSENRILRYRAIAAHGTVAQRLGCRPRDIPRRYWVNDTTVSDRRSARLTSGVLPGATRSSRTRNTFHVRYLDRRRPSFGCHTRNHLAAMATVNTKIFIRRQDDGVCEDFTHAHEASIGEAHRNIAVFFYKP